MSVGRTPHRITVILLAALILLAGVAVVLLARHDPPSFLELGRTVADAVGGARLVEIDSDHYLTLRRPQEVADTLREFLRAAAHRE